VLANDANGETQEVDVYSCKGDFLMFKWSEDDSAGIYPNQTADMDKDNPDLPWWLIKVAISVLFKRDGPIGARRPHDSNAILLGADGRW
jgi:hypothetical protein